MLVVGCALAACTSHATAGGLLEVDYVTPSASTQQQAAHACGLRASRQTFTATMVFYVEPKGMAARTTALRCVRSQPDVAGAGFPG